MGDSDDDDYVDIGRPDLVGLLPDEIDELFSTIQPEHLELIVKDSDFEKAVGTTREGSFKLSDLVELELWNELSGPIRNQKRHILCWAYSSTDLICVDKDPTALAGHSCYGTTTRKAFQFMLDNGGVPKERTLEFDCNQDPPADPEPHITINSFATFNTLEEALVQLRTQPIGAEFSQLWELGYDIYYGPTKANSYFQWGSYCYLQIEQRDCEGDDGEDEAESKSEAEPTRKRIRRTPPKRQNLRRRRRSPCHDHRDKKKQRSG
ncbi:hypothetical protein HID58_080824 [Brassica napus]|uniref:Uncharacterized protein n=1 Tax=Brassica napus TaxID=3708 RepID=A0ABQ7Y600_BRANA|nr:hypothetical protein HID58_080824 [Brassica napus]